MRAEQFLEALSKSLVTIWEKASHGVNPSNQRTGAEAAIALKIK